MENNQDKPKSGFSRRTFIKGAGLTTVGTIALQSGVMASTSETDEAKKALGPDAVTITMNVNGRSRRLNAEPRATLAKVLREELQLTGTKVVCDRGSCSACTVWLDDTPVNACMTFVMDVGDRKVTTVEGLAKNGGLHPIQEAFIEHDASQCGYCTPGMLMSTAHLLSQNPNPTIDDVKHATRGNYCRCGTYPHVFEATLAAAKKMK